MITSIYPGNSVTPKKTDQCAIVIPAYQSNLSELEKICLDISARSLSKWDSYFVCPDDLNLDVYQEKYGIRQCFFSRENFISTASYSNWMLEKDLYQRFGAYEYILVCQLDAIVIRDDLNFWVTKNLDYIGAPWIRKIHFEPNFKNKPHLTGGKFDLEVGNGGLSLRHVHNTNMIIDRYAGIISEFKAQFNFEDAMFALIGLIDKDYRVATFADAAAFSLEVSAREIIGLTGRHPMGFHNLHTHDKVLWDEIIRQYS